MFRTQVYLTEEQFQSIRILAKQYKKPFAQMFRELLEQGLHVGKISHAGPRSKRDHRSAAAKSNP
jgi:hypothetical protein